MGLFVPLRCLIPLLRFVFKYEANHLVQRFYGLHITILAGEVVEEELLEDIEGEKNPESSF